jgi:molybdopterin molybdotransferase
MSALRLMMISISEALKIIRRETFALSAETIDLENSVGRILAQAVRADMDLPPFDRSQMDGFAVKTQDVKNAPVKLKIIGESVAGKGFDGQLNSGEAVRIMTGARVPDGADSVQKVELTFEIDGFIEILEPTKKQQNFVLRGQEIKQGAKVFKKGETITAQKIATLASFGYAKIKVFRRPRVTILATGSEIVNIAETPQKDQIRNSNSAMLRVFCEPFADVRVLPLVKDDLESLKNQIAEIVGIADFKFQISDSRLPVVNSKFQISHSRFGKNPKAENLEAKKHSQTPNPKSQILNDESEIWNLKSEILIITGGVSVGDYDFTKPALRELGAEMFFERVNLKPGKPTVFARLKDTLVFGLPGNPVSVAVTFFLFARRAILQMQSAKNCELKKGFAVCSDKIKGTKERDCYLPVSLDTNEKGHLVIESLRFSGSSNFVAFSRADALVFIPQGTNLETGDAAEILFL